LINSEESKN